jgi:DNA-binding response OmpR family regulator
VIRALIVDNDRTTIESFQALVGPPRGHRGGVATTSAFAVESAGRLKPDVVLVNFEQPDLDGLATARRIRAASSSARVILMTAKDGPSSAPRRCSVAIAGL